MGTKHLFGRTIDHRHIPIADDEDVAAYALVSARMYASAPSLAQKQYTDTSGVVGTAKTSWTEVSPGEYKILFDRVTDPSPDSDDDYEQYWVVVQFTLESGGDTVFTEDVIFRDYAVVKIDYRGFRSPHPQFVFLASTGVSRSSSLDHKRRNPSGTHLAVSDCKDDTDIPRGAMGNEIL